MLEGQRRGKDLEQGSTKQPFLRQKRANQSEEAVKRTKNGEIRKEKLTGVSPSVLGGGEKIITPKKTEGEIEPEFEEAPIDCNCLDE